MSTSTVVPIKQPVPETIRSAEAAVRTIMLDPNPDVPETAYSLGYYSGSMAGLFCTFGTWTSGQIAEHDRYTSDPDYAQASPLPLGKAVATDFRFRRRDLLEACGWLQGFADATISEPNALSCDGCGRRLFEDSDDVHRCEITGGYYCQWHADICTGSGAMHQRECSDRGSL